MDQFTTVITVVKILQRVTWVLLQQCLEGEKRLVAIVEIIPAKKSRNCSLRTLPTDLVAFSQFIY